MRVNYQYLKEDCRDILTFTIGDIAAYGNEYSLWFQMPQDKTLLAKAIEEAINKLNTVWYDKTS